MRLWQGRSSNRFAENNRRGVRIMNGSPGTRNNGGDTGAPAWRAMTGRAARRRLAFFARYFVDHGPGDVFSPSEALVNEGMLVGRGIGKVGDGAGGRYRNHLGDESQRAGPAATRSVLSCIPLPVWYYWRPAFPPGRINPRGAGGDGR